MMRRTLRLAACCAVSAIFLTGCGGGDDDGGAGASELGRAPTAPQFTSQGATVHLHQVEPALWTAREMVFFTDRTFAETGATSLSGTYQYAASGDTGTLELSYPEATETLTLLFQSSSNGTYTFRRVWRTDGAIEQGGGEFTNFAPGSKGLPPLPGGGGGSPDPNPPVDPGIALLDERVMSMTRTTGQTHIYTFSGNTFQDSDPPEEGAGTFTYQQSVNAGYLVLEYLASVGPVDLVGDRHEIQLNFTDEIRGTYSSLYYTEDGAVLVQDGIFEFRN